MYVVMSVCVRIKVLSCSPKKYAMDFTLYYYYARSQTSRVNMYVVYCKCM